MKTVIAALALALSGGMAANAQSPSPAGIAVPVTVDNFIRTESYLYLGGVVKSYGFGTIGHNRVSAPIDRQTVIRLNRDNPF